MMMLSTCDCSTDMQFVCCLIRINIKTSLTVYKLRDLKINVYILKYTWVESKRIKTDLQSRCVRAVYQLAFKMSTRVQNCLLFSEKQLKNTFQVRLVKFAEGEKPSRAKRIFVPSRLSFSLHAKPTIVLYMGWMFTLQNGQNYYLLKMEMFHQNMCSVSTSFQTENIGHKSAKLSCFQLNFIPPGKTYKYNT